VVIFLVVVLVVVVVIRGVVDIPKLSDDVVGTLKIVVLIEVVVKLLGRVVGKSSSTNGVVDEIGVLV